MNDQWESLFNGLDKFSDDFMQDREQPKQQQKLIGPHFTAVNSKP